MITVILFQLLLLIIIGVTVFGLIAERDNKLRDNLTAICIASVVAFLITVYHAY